MKFKILTLLLATCASFAQQVDGYWDKERITNKEIKLSAGDKIIIKSEDFPIGTTEFVYRITLLDENQKMANDLASVLKAIPDPYFIGKGAGGAISLASAITGSDKCTYAIFDENRKALHFSKTGINKFACLYQSDAVSKDAKLISIGKSTCITENTRNLYFAFKNENWVMNEKIVLEIVPWIDNKASRGWTKNNKATILIEIQKLTSLKLFYNKLPIALEILQKLEKMYRFQDYRDFIPLEKNKILNDLMQKIYAEKPLNEQVLESIWIEAKEYFYNHRYEETIEILETVIIKNGNGKALDYNLVAKAYMFTKQFEKALSALKSAEKIDKSELLVQINLAHTYMFLDDMENCKNIHKRFLNQNVSVKQTWKNKVINDLDEFKKAGLSEENFNKVLRLVD